MTALVVVLDGVALPDEEARAFWKRFSAWMDAHPGDLAGFARSEGLASVHPEVHAGSPALVASRTAPQKPYASAPNRRAEPRGERAAPARPSGPAPKGRGRRR